MKGKQAIIIASYTILLLTAFAACSVCDIGPFSVEFSKGDLTFEKENGFDKISLQGCDFVTTPGEPQIPSVGVNVVLPTGSRAADLAVIYSNPIEFFDTFLVWPTQPPKPVSAKAIP